MADITEYLRKIESAARGEDVRDAIIGALNTINSSGGNAYTLNGIAWDKFAKQATLDAILPADTEPTANSTKMVTSGGIYDYLLKASNALDKISYGDNQTHTDSTIKQKIEELNSIKRQLKNALRAKQVEVEDSEGLSSYANKIESITINDNIEVSSITITENGEYDAAKGKSISSDKGYAYNPITVDVKPNVTSKSISRNGTFKASDDGYDGYSSVNVDVSSSLMTLAVTSEDMPDDPSETKVFRVDTNANPDKIGYNEVSVNVGGKFGIKELEVDPSAGVRVEGDEGSYAIEQTIEASSDNVWGWNKIHITFKESEGPFTVNFYVDTKKVDTVTVPKNGYARFTKERPTKEGHVFAGWNPEPTNVTQNLDCYAQFDKEDESSSGGGGGGAGNSNWKEIGNNAGENAVAGETSLTMYYAPFSWSNMSFAGGKVTATCSEKNVHGATSIWSFDLYLRLNDGSDPGAIIATPSPIVNSAEEVINFDGYNASLLPSFCDALKGAIQQMNTARTKYSGSVMNKLKSSITIPASDHIGGSTENADTIEISGGMWTHNVNGGNYNSTVNGDKKTNTLRWPEFGSTAGETVAAEVRPYVAYVSSTAKAHAASQNYRTYQGSNEWNLVMEIAAMVDGKSIGGEDNPNAIQEQFDARHGSTPHMTIYFAL